MTAGIYNLLLEQGSATTIGFEIVDDLGALVPLAGCSAVSAIKRGYNYQSPLLTATTSINQSTSVVSVTFTDYPTSTLPFNCLSSQIPANYATLAFDKLPKAIQNIAFVWDLKIIYSNGVPSRTLQGVVLVTPQVAE